MLQLLLFLLPLGLDTLGVSISLGIKSYDTENATHQEKRHIPAWLSSALLFALAETVMPLVGLAIGYAASLAISGVMHVVGSLLLIAVGVWELQEEFRERLQKRKQRNDKPERPVQTEIQQQKQFSWSRQLLLALSISLDELAIGFSLGTITSSIGHGTAISPLVICIWLGLQGFLMTFIGLISGRTLRQHLKAFKEWGELLSGILLIGLGIWLFFS